MRLTRRTRLWRYAVGGPSLAPLGIAHAFAGIADGFVTVSLAGSLFFNLSPDASRNQVLLYLIVTVAPLAVLAPLVGPFIDRFRRHQRLLAGACFAIRALLCLALASSLYQLSFYGFALGLLVVVKAQGIVKQALIPLLVEDPAELVAANARIPRFGALMGAVGGGLGIFLLDRIEASGLLRAAAVVFALAAFAVMKTRPASPPENVLAEVEYAELHLPTIVVGSIGVMAIRAAVGFFTFTLAFTLRRASESAAVYGVAVVVYGAGAFVGTLSSPRLRKRFQDSQMIGMAIAAPSIPTLIGILGVSRALLMVIAVLIGFSTTLGKHAFDSMLQHRAPVALRGRAAARYETRFQLVWALGALVATPISFPAEASMAILSALYIPALFVYLRASNAAQLFEAKSMGVFGRAERRLAGSEQSLIAGANRVAIIEAAAAVDLARVADPTLSVNPEVRSLDGLRDSALDPTSTIDDATAQHAVDLANSLLSLVEEPPSPPSP